MGKNPLANATQSDAFVVAKQTRDGLESECRRCSDILNAHPGHASGHAGITPDRIKASPEWKEKKNAVDVALRNLQNFNQRFTKTFKNELAQERAERRRT